jgi:hypothetical protein
MLLFFKCQALADLDQIILPRFVKQSVFDSRA